MTLRLKRLDFFIFRLVYVVPLLIEQNYFSKAFHLLAPLNRQFCGRNYRKGKQKDLICSEKGLIVCARQFAYVIVFIFLRNRNTWILLSPFYRYENQGTERLSHFPNLGNEGSTNASNLELSHFRIPAISSMAPPYASLLGLSSFFSGWTCRHAGSIRSRADVQTC